MYCRRNNTSLRSAGRNSFAFDWAQLVDTNTSPGDIAYVPAFSVTHSGIFGFSTVVLSQEEYDRLRQFEFSRNNQSATHAYSLGLSAYIASLQKPQVLQQS